MLRKEPLQLPVTIDFVTKCHLLDAPAVLLSLLCTVATYVTHSIFPLYTFRQPVLMMTQVCQLWNLKMS